MPNKSMLESYYKENFIANFLLTKKTAAVHKRQFCTFCKPSHCAIELNDSRQKIVDF